MKRGITPWWEVLQAMRRRTTAQHEQIEELQTRQYMNDFENDLENNLKNNLKNNWKNNLRNNSKNNSKNNLNDLNGT